MEDITVAAAQIECKMRDKEGNLKKHEEFAKVAAKQGAEIVAFPECSVHGMLMHPDVYYLAEKIPGPSTERLIDAGKSNDIIILAGIAERGDSDAVYNTHVVVGPRGFIGKYRKVHLAHGEHPHYRGGFEYPIFKTPKCRIGVEICYDSEFPEVSRILALQGAEVLFVCFAWNTSSPWARDRMKWRDEKEHLEIIQARKREFLTYLPSRALDNGAYLVTSNQCGISEDRYHTGVCLVFDPLGQLIAECLSPHDDLVVAKLEKKRLEERRADMDYTAKCRRPDTYGYLTEPA